MLVCSIPVVRDDSCGGITLSPGEELIARPGGFFSRGDAGEQDQPASVVVIDLSLHE